MAGFVPGGSPSESPELCYGMWTSCAFPVLFDDVSPSDVKDAFYLWFREQGRPLPDPPYAAPFLGESEGSTSDSTSSAEASDDNGASSSDVESDVESEHRESRCSGTLSTTEAAADHGLLDHSFPSLSSPRASFDVESASEYDSDSDCYSPWSHLDEDGTQPSHDLGLHSRASVAPPSPSAASIGNLSSTLSSWNDQELEIDGHGASEGALRNQEDEDDASNSGLYYDDSFTNSAELLDFMFYDGGLLFDAVDDEYSPSSAEVDVDPHAPAISAPSLSETDSSATPSSSHEPGGCSLAPMHCVTEGGELNAAADKTHPDDGESVEGTRPWEDSLPPPAESLVSRDGVRSTEGGVKECECAVPPPASTSLPIQEAAQGSTGAAVGCGAKRGREEEEDSDDAATAGPSNKVSFCGPAWSCIP